MNFSRRELSIGAGVLTLGALVWLGRRREPPSPHERASAQATSPTSPSAIAEAALPEHPGEIGTSTLLSEMIDLARLARLPEPPYTAHLASSYDRRSRSAADPEGWFANDDWASAARPNYLRVETNAGRREYVLLDVDGPGAIVRLWTATPTGTLRIYFDERETPTIEGSLTELLSGESRFPRGLAYVAARGYNSYFPLPFQRHCKLTVDSLIATDPFRGGPLEKFYYQINYRIYAPEQAARVRTFTRSDFERVSSLSTQVAHTLDRPSELYRPSHERTLGVFQASGDGASFSLSGVTGAAVREISLRVSDTSDAALRRARISLQFDAQPPTVVPLGDFFAGGPGLSPHAGLPLEVRADGTFISRFVMPFRESVSIEVRDITGVEGEVSVEPWVFDARSLYFRALWQPTRSASTRPFQDLTLLDVRGQGTYVGNAFSFTNPSGARWWGEGDEKLYVDGQDFPGLFGTGTEDYYGYAWSGTAPFSRAFHALTRAEGPGFDGRSAMNRFHVLDAVPFTQSLRFDLELWHWEPVNVSWDSVAYYYSRPAAEQQ